MYKIKAPSEEYDRKIGGVQFVNGEAQTDNEWLASWFSGRTGFTVETVTAEVRSAIRRRSTVRLIWLFRQAAALWFGSTARPIG